MSSETALCVRCQKDFDCKDWIESALVTPENLRHPPDGTKFEQSAGGFRIVVSTRSYWWLFFLPIACIWSALLLFFSYAFFHAHPGIRWMFYVLLTPFFLVGAWLWGCALMPLFGKVAIEVEGDAGNIFKGIGLAGWRRRFDWGGVRRIRLSTYYMENRNQEQITLEGDQIIQLARGVKHERLCYMLIALRQNLRRKTDVQRQTHTP